MAQRDEYGFAERVVKIVETCDGEVDRVYYCIHDREYQHWMSGASFEGELWTKCVHRRREFESRSEARSTLENLREWRKEQEAKRDRFADIPFEGEAA